MSLNRLYTRWAAVVGLVVAILVTGGLFATTTVTDAETTPESGAPSASESAQVARIVSAFPESEGTSIWVVFNSETDITADQLEQINANLGDIREEFTEIPMPMPAQVSEGGTAAVGIFPIEKLSEVGEKKDRYESIRELAGQNVDGLEVLLSGPEGFIVDISNVFAGADFTLLAVTASVVVVLLLVTYRSPILWIIPLAVVGAADALAGQMAKFIAEQIDQPLDASTTGILSVLVFGAGTNYALLLISRYREELMKFESRGDAMAKAVRGVTPAILASGGTVLLVMATLLFANLDSNQNLGLAGFVGIAVAMVSGIVTLPFALVVFPRWIFWPRVPRSGTVAAKQSLWARSGAAIARRPVITGVASVLLALILAAPAMTIQSGLTQAERFLSTPDSVTGQVVLTDKFEAFQGSRVTVISPDDDVTDVVAYLEDRSDVTSVAPGSSAGGYTQVSAVFDYVSEGDEIKPVVTELRTDLDAIGSGAAWVGGTDAQVVDTEAAIRADENLIFPTVLAIVFIMLVMVLRALVAPVLLLATVVGSYFAAIGASWVLFQTIWGFPALDSNVYVLSFLFLVALGIDYNMFLMTRVKEESEELEGGVPAGIRAGMIRALGATGGVITSAGILLAAVFAVLGVLPLITLTQIGVIVCVGVLLDTLLVRTVVVPSLTFLVGERMWWPRRPAGRVSTSA